MRYVEYKITNGEIIGYYDVPEEIAEIMKQNGQHIIQSDTAFHDTHYVEVETELIKERPTQKTVIDRTECNPLQIVTVSKLPEPCKVSIKNKVLGIETKYEVDDGVLEWDTDLAGTYIFKVEAFPYIPFEREVVVIEGST